MQRILIVDDETHIRILLQQTLEEFEEMNVEILTAENGRKAVEIIKDKKPNLIFLDVMMPELNGYDTCYKIKKELKVNAFVVMLTAKGQEVDKKKGLECGADVYMTKPFDPDEIIKIASEILEVKIGN